VHPTTGRVSGGTHLDLVEEEVEALEAGEGVGAPAVPGGLERERRHQGLHAVRAQAVRRQVQLAQAAGITDQVVKNKEVWNKKLFYPAFL
jgi:hypothetical protein